MLISLLFPDYVFPRDLKGGQTLLQPTHFYAFSLKFWNQDNDNNKNPAVYLFSQFHYFMFLKFQKELQKVSQISDYTTSLAKRLI